MKNLIILILIAGVVVFGYFAYVKGDINWFKKDAASTPAEGTETDLGDQIVPQNKEKIQGKIFDVALSARVVTIDTDDGAEIDLPLVQSTKLYDRNGKEVNLSYFSPDMKIEAEGEFSHEIIFLPLTIREVQ